MLATVLLCAWAFAGSFTIQVTNTEESPTNTTMMMPSIANTTNYTTPLTMMTPTDRTTIRNIYSTFKLYYHMDATKCHLQSASKGHLCDAFNHHSNDHNDDTKQQHCESMEFDFGQHNNAGNKHYHGESISYYRTTTSQQYSNFYQNYQNVYRNNTMQQP
ncbi:hypothetical protein KOW79_001971 [Hemibagrus wyckioides]|uniref:Uncharacterized protein n=1 Tax=Hemibagrus wyckioides TaxID=337641 RepID=A0A9D3SUF7_9TELE|nr:hypothetical protein KOW79_001971 [Hemibagrus wyckioides]